MQISNSQPLKEIEVLDRGYIKFIDASYPHPKNFKEYQESLKNIDEIYNFRFFYKTSSGLEKNSCFTKDLEEFSLFDTKIVKRFVEEFNYISKDHKEIKNLQIFQVLQNLTIPQAKQVFQNLQARMFFKIPMSYMEDLKDFKIMIVKMFDEFFIPHHDIKICNFFDNQISSKVIFEIAMSSANKYYKSLKDANIDEDVAKLCLPLSRYVLVQIEAQIDSWFLFIKKYITNQNSPMRSYAIALYDILYDLTPISTELFGVSKLRNSL